MTRQGGRIGLATLLTAGFAVLAAVGAVAAENRHGVAVIIGNKSYSEKIPAVAYAHNDAAAMKAWVIGALGYRPGNVIDLSDARLADLRATFGDDRTHKGQLFNWVRAGKSDVVVFFSGHGVPGLKDRRGYLLPSDGRADLAELTGYSVDTLLGNLAKIGARSVTVILDACFSGNSPAGMLIDGISGLSVTPKAARAGDIALLTAARGDQVASWDERAGHGLFTSHLLAALRGKADGKEYGNGDGKVTLGEVKKYLDDELSYQARRRYNRDQNPTVEGPPDRVLATYVPGSSRPNSLQASVGPAAETERLLGLPRAHRAAIQRGLDGLGFEVGPADGLFGPKTRAAIRKWQAAKGFPASGFLTRDQSDVLAAKGEEVRVAVALPAPNTPGPLPEAAAPYRSGEILKDCPFCPEMVVVPPGSFMMGSPEHEKGRDANEGPRHRVTIERPLAVGKFEVTFEEWDACVADGGCGGHRPGDNGWGRGRRPVINVSWNDVQVYVKWLSWKTNKTYRLLSEAEWEYVARAGTTTRRWWGDDPDEKAACRFANIGDRHFGCADGHRKIVLGGLFAANPFGLHDVLGNVWEWVGDCWSESYTPAPADGDLREPGACTHRVIRGGSWLSEPRAVRSARRSKYDVRLQTGIVGFRVARTLDTNGP
jgi:formylglycine-generating enzyme required for sulfatase activity